MGTFNPLVIILKENKLTGPNYIHRNRNLDIVLTAEGHKYVLTMVCPPQPPKNATEQEAKAYKDWIKAHEIARHYILASMSNKLQHQLYGNCLRYDVEPQRNIWKLKSCNNASCYKRIDKCGPC